MVVFTFKLRIAQKQGSRQKSKSEKSKSENTKSQKRLGQVRSKGIWDFGFRPNLKSPNLKSPNQKKTWTRPKASIWKMFLRAGRSIFGERAKTALQKNRAPTQPTKMLPGNNENKEFSAYLELFFLREIKIRQSNLNGTDSVGFRRSRTLFLHEKCIRVWLTSRVSDSTLGEQFICK